MTTQRLVARRTAVALFVAGALGGGCRGAWIPGWLASPLGEAGPQAASPAIAPAAMTDLAALQARRDQLRDRRARAWERIRAGERATDYRPAEALELSTLEAELDAATPWQSPPAPGRATLADLPRRHWWHLVVAPGDWHRGPLAVDDDGAPGAYAALVAALEAVTAGEAPALTPAWYEALHDTSSFGVFNSDGTPASSGFLSAPASFPSIPLHDPAAATAEHLAASLAEMKAEGLATWSADVQRQHPDPVTPWLRAVLEPLDDINPHSKAVQLVYRQDRDERGAPGYRHWLVAATDYGAGEARSWVAQWLTEYRDEAARVGRRVTGPAYLDALATGEPSPEIIETLRPLTRLVRRLSVGHVFAGGNERVAAMLLLNRLLRDQGLPPATVADVAVFDGRAPTDQLARAVFDGQKRFQRLVQELAIRASTEARGQPAASVAPMPAGERW
jgi:hypothetical protein